MSSLTPHLPGQSAMSHDDYALAPEFLDTPEYDDVRKTMLETDVSLSSALIIARRYEGYYNEQLPKNSNLDTSFTRQFSEFVAGSTPEDHEHEAILFTEFSAVPVADAVRGYYDGLKRPLPRLATIKANRDLTERFYSPSRSTVFRTRNEKQEIKRLSQVLDGIRKLAIVDQFVNSGNTQRYAVGLVFAASKINNIALVQGRWYEETLDKDKIDLDAVTSSHQDVMYNIGQSAVS